MSSRPEFFTALQAPGMLAIAHRGAGDVAPENTFAAFQAAVDLGYFCLETDVQTSRDGTCYVFHDATLKRLTGEKGRIDDLPDAVIDKLRVYGAHSIPKLKDLFEAFPDTLFSLDAKTPAAAEPMANLILEMNRKAQVSVGSINDARTKSMLDILGPDTCHPPGLRGIMRFFIASKLGLDPRLETNFWQVPIWYYGVRLVSAKTLEFSKDHGLKTHVWTVNDQPTICKLIALGVDGIMSDDCGLLKSELISAGLWQGQK